MNFFLVPPFHHGAVKVWAETMQMRMHWVRDHLGWGEELDCDLGGKLMEWKHSESNNREGPHTDPADLGEVGIVRVIQLVWL